MTDIVSDDISYAPVFQDKVFREEWTEERNALLITLRGENKLTRRGIAEEINRQTGSHFTKAAVCGRIDRIFPAARPRKTEAEKAASIRAQRDRRNAKLRDAAIAKRASLGLAPRPVCRKSSKSMTDQPTLRCVELAPLSIALLDLDKSHCRYPYGEDASAMTFCGHPKKDGSSYCVPHYFLTRREVAA